MTRSVHPSRWLILRHAPFLIVLAACLLPASAPAATVDTSYGLLPLTFEANRGQTDKRVRFMARGHGYSLFLTPKEAVCFARAIA